MATLALSRSRQSRAGSTRRSSSGSVLTDATNIANKAKLDSAINVYLDKVGIDGKAKRNFAKGITETFGIDRNKFNYELRKEKERQRAEAAENTENASSLPDGTRIGNDSVPPALESHASALGSRESQSPCERHTRQGSYLEVFAEESIRQLVDLDDKGAELLERVQEPFSNKIRPILGDIHDKIKQDFAVIGSRPAKQFVFTCKDVNETAGLNMTLADLLVANDIDCFYGTARSGPFIMEGMPQKQDVNGCEVNLCRVRNYNIKKLLENNDINATAFAINVKKEENGSLSFQFHVSPHFWRFALSQDPVLRAVNPKHAKARTLVRLAFKSFEMKIPFEDGAIKAGSENLPLSQKEKVDKMNDDWPNNPLSGFTIVPKGSAYLLTGGEPLVGNVHYPPTEIDVEMADAGDSNPLLYRDWK